MVMQGFALISGKGERAPSLTSPIRILHIRSLRMLAWCGVLRFRHLPLFSFFVPIHNELDGLGGRVADEEFSNSRIGYHFGGSCAV
jgi:hypothetical protein